MLFRSYLDGDTLELSDNEAKRLAYEEELRRVEEEREAARLAWEEESRRIEEENAGRIFTNNT